MQLRRISHIRENFPPQNAINHRPVTHQRNCRIIPHGIEGSLTKSSKNPIEALKALLARNGRMMFSQENPFGLFSVFSLLPLFLVFGTRALIAQRTQ